MSGDISNLLCCTCLSEDRKLFQLCRVPDGLNLLYMLLMCDTDAYREGFFKDTASWMMCWECCAIIKRIRKFRRQTCTAMTRLKDIANGWNKETEPQSLSCLSTYNNPAMVIETDPFVDCDLDINKIKKEEPSVETLETIVDDCHSYDEPSEVKDKEVESEKKTHSKVKDKEFDLKKNILSKTDSEIKVKEHIPKTRIIEKIKEFYTVTVMDSEELKEVVDKRKLELSNVIKCESCVIGFKDESCLNTHNLELHTKKENHSICHVCLSYIEDDTLDTHTRNHYQSFVCKLCDYRAYAHKLIIKHLKEIHAECFGKKKKRFKGDLKPDETVRYPCSECDMTFVNKGTKWKHVQKCHRDGHKCVTCQKVFAFKHNLQRHELIHKGPQPRTECPQCKKQVRTTLMPTHARTHELRARFTCVPCGKAFVCRATYESHLKYANAHATQDTLRYPCSLCEKKFRSRGELRDHVAYRHELRVTYKCPVCNKALATRRCVNRHVRRAHDGIKENARDKMCDYCGKAFRDKQSLSEHLSRHTGARPLACTRCGRAFRQRAALHAHMRRLHPDT